MNRVAKNFIFITCSNLLSQLLVFLTGAYYARIVGISLFGDVTTVQNMINYFTIFVSFGLQTYGTREVAKNDDKIDKVTGDILSFRIILFVISFIVIFVISLFFAKFEHNVVLAKLFVIWGLTLLPTAVCIDWVYSGLQKMGYNAIYNIIKTGLPFLLLYLFLKNKRGIYLIPIFTVAALVVGSIYQMYIFFIREKFYLKLRFNKASVKKYVVYGFPFVTSGILAVINGNIDRLVIYFSRGSYEAGIYGGAYYPIFFLTNVVSMIFIPIFPAMITYFNEGSKEKMKELMSKTSRLIAAFIVPVTAGGIILSKDIIVFILGKNYSKAGVPFSILIFYILILFFREIYGNGLNACNLEKKYLKAVFVSAVLNFIFNVIFTPKYGMNVAASITVASEVVNLVMMKYYSRDVIIVKNTINIVKVIVPTLIMAAVTMVFKYYNINIVINIAASSVVFISAVFITKYITVSEIKSLIRKE